MLDTPALRADLYELTMMQGYWAHGRAAEWAAFELYFRRVPEGGGFCIAAGIEDAIDLIQRSHFTTEQIEYLRSLDLFQVEFLDYLATLRFTGQLRAVPEGTVVFPLEPIIEVCAPIIEAQWLESMLLNCVNFQTLIATKAARIVQAAHPAEVIEFGLRRAQGPNGALWASRAAYVAGTVGTSNLEAGARFGIPVFGTHAHSWVQSFDSEAESFRAYSTTFPSNSTLLLDTYDTLQSGIQNAIAEAHRMAALGQSLAGVRLDSGDLAYLSKECRRRLDAEGLHNVKIIASSDIDEYLLQELKLQGAPIDAYGVGTRLATAFSEPALGGVYKLVAIRRDDHWRPKIKISANPVKTTIPGRKQVYRWQSKDAYQADAIALESEAPPKRIRHPDIEYKQTVLPSSELRPLLQLCWDGTSRVTASPTLPEIRNRVREELESLPVEHQRLANPHIYRVGLSESLYQLRRQMIADAQ